MQKTTVGLPFGTNYDQKIHVDVHMLVPRTITILWYVYLCYQERYAENRQVY